MSRCKMGSYRVGQLTTERSDLINRVYDDSVGARLCVRADEIERT